MFELAIILDGKQIDTTHDDEITLRRHFVGFMDDHDLRRKGDSNRGELIRCTTDQVVGSYEVWRG